MWPPNREVNVMIILLSVIAAVITGAPLAGVVLVTVASRREETAYSIAGRAPGPLARAARRVVAFHARGISRPASRVAARRGYRWADNPAEDDLAPNDDLALVGGGRPRS
jgi:hypothetical protein